MKPKRFIIALFPLLCFVSAMFLSNSAFALDESAFYKKNLVQSLLTCYKDDYTKKEIEGIRYTDLGTGEVPNEVFDQASSQPVLLPNIGLSNNKKSISCKIAFNGDSKINGLLNLFGKKWKIEEMGYKHVEIKEPSPDPVQPVREGYNKCLYVTYMHPKNGNSSTVISSTSNYLCFKVDENGDVGHDRGIPEYFIDTKNPQPTVGDGGIAYFYLTYLSEGENGVIRLNYSVTGGLDQGGGTQFMNDPTQQNAYIDCEGEDWAFNRFKSCVESYWPSHTVVMHDKRDNMNPVPYVVQRITPVFVDNDDGGDDDGGDDGGGSLTSEWVWRKGSENQQHSGGKNAFGLKGYEMNAAYLALWNLTGNDSDSYNNWLFTEQERFDLLSYYIQNEMSKNSEIKFIEGECYDSLESIGDGYAVYTAEKKWCKIVGEQYGGKYNVVNVEKMIEGGYFGLIEKSFEDILKEIKTFDYSIIDPGGGMTPGPADPDPSTVETDPCYKNSGSLGWILCPVINAAAGVGQHMWNQIETYHMKIPASEVFKDGGGVQKGWKVVRDLANTVFVILFMVVIFSQLTGVGIDNYGIKKILPRLIVTAIILNLSYIICQIAVDLSNIFGMGLNNMFSEWASSIATPGNGGSIGGMWAAGGILAGIGTAGAVIWGFLNTGSIAGALVWIGLAVLGIVLIIVVAMLFLYITLIAREAGIVLLIVLAPIAIVCYILPNTEKIGKKWFDLLKALLLVYPICGAMIGGGQLAGAILSSIDNEGMRLAAAIIQVIPFFFVPAVLKNSLSLMGNIGAKLSSLGRNIGRRGSNFVQNGVKNSNRFKDWSQYQQNQTATRRAQRVKNRLDRRSGGNVANLSARQQDRLSKANELLKAEANRRQQARINADNANYTAAVAKQTLENDENALDTAQYNDQAVITAEQTKRQNARVERQAEADVGVYALNGALAMSRARSRRSAQELKAYQDQYASYDQNALRQEISTAGTWLAQEGGSQRMSALLGALEANGMERDIFGVLRSHSTTLSGAGYEGVMQTLTASKNKVLKAYGKRGQSVDYTTFMTGTGANSLQGYIREKGKDFIDGLDDKALAEIASHTVGGQTGGAMSTDLLIEAAAKINSQDAIDQVDGMLRTRTDFHNNISGEQTTQFNDSTVTVLLSHAQSRAALEHAVDAAANDPNLVSKYSAHRKHTFNTAFRNGGSKPYMQ